MKFVLFVLSMALLFSNYAQAQSWADRQVMQTQMDRARDEALIQQEEIEKLQRQQQEQIEQMKEQEYERERAAAEEERNRRIEFHVDE